MKSIYYQPKLMWLILFSAASLLFIWPLPGTIALRHVFLGIGFFASLYYLYQQRFIFLKKAAWPIWLFLGFYVWLIIHLFFYSHEWHLQVAEFSSVWMRSALATPLGLALGLALTQEQHKSNSIENRKSAFSKYSLLILYFGLAGTFLIFFSRYMYEVFVTGVWLHFPFYEIPYKAKPPFVIGSALLLPLCFIIIDRSLNALTKKYWFFLGLLGVALVSFGDFFANTKNGMIILVICFILLFLRILISRQWNANKFFLGAPILVTLLIVIALGVNKHIEKNSAWSNLVDDIRIASDIHNQNWWKDGKVCCAPLNSSDRTVDISTYQRTAWFIVGIDLLAENPQGYGLIHHSFGWLAGAKYPDFSKPIGGTRGATHSAWMDFALAVGIPGLLLVLIPLWISWYRSLHQVGLWASYVSWTIPVITFAYLITEANEAHFIELLFFLVAFFYGVTLPKAHPKTSSSGTSNQE